MFQEGQTIQFQKNRLSVFTHLKIVFLAGVPGVSLGILRFLSSVNLDLATIGEAAKLFSFIERQNKTGHEKLT